MKTEALEKAPLKFMERLWTPSAFEKIYFYMRCKISASEDFVVEKLCLHKSGTNFLSIRSKNSCPLPKHTCQHRGAWSPCGPLGNQQRFFILSHPFQDTTFL